MPEIAAWVFLTLLCISLVWFALRSAKQWRLRTSSPKSDEEVLSQALQYAQGSDPGEALRLLRMLDDSVRVEVRVQAAMLSGGIYCERSQFSRAVAEFEKARKIALANRTGFLVSEKMWEPLRRAYLSSGNAPQLDDWADFAQPPIHPQKEGPSDDR